MTQINNEPNAVQTATNRIEAIRTAIANGDQKFKASDLAAARNELEFAELQDAAKKHAEQKADLARRTARTREFEKQLKQIADDDSLPKAKLSFEQALRAYVKAAERHNNALREMQESLANEGLQPNGVNSEGVTIEVKYPSGSNQPFVIGGAEAHFTDLRKPLHDFVDSNLNPGV